MPPRASQYSFANPTTTGWPPHIAELMGTSGSIFNKIVTDWKRGYVYVAVDYGGYAKYKVELITQPAPIATGTDPVNGNINALAVDPLSGNLFISRTGTNSGPNSCPIIKLNPSNFNILGEFGNTPAIFWNYPTTILPADDMTVVTCNGVSYVLVKESVFSGNVAAIFADTMQQAGWYQPVVSGSVDNRGYLCAGKSGSTATAYATWSNGWGPTIPIWVITIGAGAELWNPATGPASNPFFSTGLVGNLNASAIDPAWTQMVMQSIGYDNADGNIIVSVRNWNDSGIAVNAYLVKVSSVDATILWTVPISTGVVVDLSHSNIWGTLWVYENSYAPNPVRSWKINTFNGQAQIQTITGVLSNLPCNFQTDSESNLIVTSCLYTYSSPNSPLAISGTPNSFQDYAIIGGGVPPLILGPPGAYMHFLTCCDRAIMAHLYQITTASGVSDYFTDFDVDINYNGVVWKSGSLRFEGLQRKVGIGISIDEQTLKIWASPTDTIFGGGLFLTGAEEGLLDGALIVRWRIVWEFTTGNAAFDVTLPPLFAWKLFTGYMGQITKGGSSHVEFKVKSAMVRLNLNMPRNYYQPGCLWTLFDHGCTLPKAMYHWDSTVLATNANTVAPYGGINPAVGPDNIAFFAQGRLTFHDGPNAGLQVLIDTNDTVNLLLAYPLNQLPNIGDHISFTPGCSKSYNTCKLKFNNQNNFRGFDKVPPVMVSV